MPEQNEGLSPEETVPISPEELPTTLEIAKQGTELYESLIYSLSDKKLKNKIVRDLNVRECFTGVSPEIEAHSGSIFDELKPDEIEIFEKKLSSLTQDFMLIHHKEKDSFSFINLLAAKRVIQFHSSYFPNEAHVNLKEWLLNSPNEWIDSYNADANIRFGLLSGFPLDSVTKFQICEESPDIGDVMRHPDILEEEYDFLLNFNIELVYGRILENDSRIPKVRYLFHKYLPVLEDKIIDIQLSRRIMDNHHIQFIAYSKRDEEYAKEIDKMYDQSGIDDVAKSLQNDEENR
jgi:hypothetical protein